MSLEELKEALRNVRHTNVTKKVHQQPYDAILSSRPELTQEGKTILITGGGTGVGLAIARAFIRASAATIIIIGRREDVLENAKNDLENVAKLSGKQPKIMLKPCDVTDLAAVQGLWDGLEQQNIFVDVYIANAAKFTDTKPMLELGADEVWSQVRTNVESPIYFAERFWKQPNDNHRFIVNITTGNIHAQSHPQVALRPAYTLSKLSATLFFQLLASDHLAEKMQIVSVHPGLIFNEYWRSLSLTEDLFDSDELTGCFVVWAATAEASFLHGRMAWVSWDVNELASGHIKKRIDEDPDFLRASIVGLKQGTLV